jgi:hypothetical protein
MSSLFWRSLVVFRAFNAAQGPNGTSKIPIRGFRIAAPALCSY